MGHGLPRHHRPGKVRSRFSEETFAGVSSRDGVAPKADDASVGSRDPGWEYYDNLASEETMRRTPEADSNTRITRLKARSLIR